MRVDLKVCLYSMPFNKTHGVSCVNFVGWVGITCIKMTYLFEDELNQT